MNRLFLRMALFCAFLMGITIYAEHGKLLYSFEGEEGMEKLAKMSELATLTDDVDEDIKAQYPFAFTSMRSNAEYPRMLRFPKGGFPRGKRIMARFEYYVEQAAARKQFVAIFVQDTFDQNGKRTGENRFDYYSFGHKQGEKSFIELCAKIPEEGAKTYLHLGAWGKGKLAIKSLKFYDYTDIDWVFDKKYKKGFSSPITNGRVWVYSDNVFDTPQEKFLPLLDKYGQFKHKDWPEKIKSDADFEKMKAVEKKFNDSLKPLPARDEFGGYLSDNYKFKATGKFRTEKVNGKWFLITPKGNLFWSMGVNAVNDTAPHTIITDREYMFEGLLDEYKRKTCFSPSSYGKAYAPCIVYDFGRLIRDKKYGKEEANVHNIPRLQKWGFNTVGAWASKDMYKAQKMPYTFIVNTGHCYSYNPLKKDGDKKHIPGSGFWDCYKDDLKECVKKEIMQNIDIINSPYCIGVMVNNEPNFGYKPGEMMQALVMSSRDRPSKARFGKMLEKKYGAIENLNKSWQTKYRSWDDFLKCRDYVEFKGNFAVDAAEFERELCEYYFKNCRDAVKECVPDALYMGCRFAVFRNEIDVAVASKYADVIVFNIYEKNPTKHFKLPKDYVDKPILIGEYSFPTSERGNFAKYGSCATRNDADRLNRTKTYITECLQSPYVVGCHWFEWASQTITGRNAGGENYGFGLVDTTDTPMWNLVKQFRDISETMYQTRLK